MPGQKPAKMVVIATHGMDDPEKATVPFVRANAALAMDATVTVVLQSNGVTNATRGVYEHILAPGFEPLQKLVDAFVELGGTLLVCRPCIESRKIPPTRLVAGAEMVQAGRVMAETLEAISVVTY